MRRMGIVLVLALLCAARLSAQTHPCDAADVTSGTATTGQMVTLSACHDGKDTNGNVVTLTGWALYDNGTRTTPTLAKVGTPSPVSGLQQYTTSFTAPSSASVHTYQVAAVDAAGESAKSTPFVLTVSLPLTVPHAPLKTRVQ